MIQMYVVLFDNVGDLDDNIKMFPPYLEVL